MLYKRVIYKKGVKIINVGVSDIYHVGNHINIENVDHVVISSIIKKERNIIVDDLELIKISDLKISVIKNEKLQGSSIKAKVINLENKNGRAFMNVDFDYGLEFKNKGRQIKNKNTIPIPYKTFYSKTNTGLFPTPEINDIVDVVFYSNDESDVKVSWAIENENSSRFNEINIRNYSNEKFDLKLEEGTFSIFSKDKININSKDSNILSQSIFIKSEKALGLASNKYIALESKTDLSIYGSEIKLKSLEKDIKLLSNAKLFLKGKTIHNE